MPSAGFGITGPSTTGTANTRHIFVRVGGTDSNTQAGAVAANDYFTFTISPTTGYVLNLSSLTFDLARGVSTADIFIRTSLDGFTSTIYSNTTLTTGSTLSAATPVLFDSSYQNLTEPFEVRFYFADNSHTTSDNSVVNARLDNIILNGDVVPIPEPGAALLFGLAALPFVGCRRRSCVTLR